MDNKCLFVEEKPQCTSSSVFFYIHGICMKPRKTLITYFCVDQGRKAVINTKAVLKSSLTDWTDFWLIISLITPAWKWISRVTGWECYRNTSLFLSLLFHTSSIWAAKSNSIWWMAEWRGSPLWRSRWDKHELILSLSPVKGLLISGLNTWKLNSSTSFFGGVGVGGWWKTECEFFSLTSEVIDLFFYRYYIYIYIFYFDRIWLFCLISKVF